MWSQRRTHAYVCVCVVSCSVVSISVASWPIACQAPLPTEFSRQGDWSGGPFPSLGDLLYPGIETVALASPVLAGRFVTSSAIWDAHIYMNLRKNTYTDIHIYIFFNSEKYIYIYIYIYIYLFPDSFPLWVIMTYWIQFPVLYSRTCSLFYI